MKRRWLTISVVALAVSLACANRGEPPVQPGGSPPDRVSYMALAPYGSPQDVSVGAGSVWVTTRQGDGGSVLRVAPDTSEIIADIEVTGPYPPFRIAVGEGAVWVSTGGEGSGAILRIDPGTNRVTATVPVEGGPQELAVGHGALWAQTLLPLDDGKIVRIDPASNEVAATIRLKGEASDVAAGEGAVWALAGGGPDGKVVKVDPLTNETVVSTDLRNPLFWNKVAAGEGAVWVASQIPGPNGVSVWRIDPASAEVVSEPLSVGGGFFGIGVGAGAVWVWTGIDQAVAQVDAGTNRVVARIPVRGGGSAQGLPPGVAVGYGAVWMTGASDLIRIAL